MALLLVLHVGPAAAQDPRQRCELVHTEPAPSPAGGHRYRIWLDPALSGLGPQMVEMVKNGMARIYENRSGRYLADRIASVTPDSKAGFGDIYLVHEENDYGLSYFPTEDCVRFKGGGMDSNLSISQDFRADFSAQLYHELVHKHSRYMREFGAYSSPWPRGLPAERLVGQEYLEEMLTIGNPFAQEYSFPCENMYRDEVGLPRRLTHSNLDEGFWMINSLIDPDAMERLKTRLWMRFPEPFRNLSNYSVDLVNMQKLLLLTTEMWSSPAKIRSGYTEHTRNLVNAYPMSQDERRYVQELTAPIWAHIEKDPFVASGQSRLKEARDLQKAWDPVIAIRLARYHNYIQKELFGKIIPFYDYDGPSRGRMNVALWCSRREMYVPDKLGAAKGIFFDPIPPALDRPRVEGISRDRRVYTPHRLRSSSEEDSKWKTFQDWETGHSPAGQGGSPGASKLPPPQEDVPLLAPTAEGNPVRPARQVILQTELDPASTWKAQVQYLKAPEDSIWIKWEAGMEGWERPSGHQAYGQDLRIGTHTRLLILGHGRGIIEGGAGGAVADAVPVTFGGLRAEVLAARTTAFLQGVYREGKAYFGAPDEVHLMPCDGSMALDTGGEFEEFARQLSSSLCGSGTPVRK